MEGFRSETAARFRHNRLYLGAALTPYLLGLTFVFFAAVTQTVAVLVPVPHSLIFGTLALAYALKANKDPVRLPGPLVVTETELRHDGELVARREDLKDGILVPEDGKTLVRIRKKGLHLPLLFEVTDEEEGRALLRALGFDTTQTVAELRAASDLFRWSLWKQLAYLLVPVFFVFLPLLFTGVLTLGPNGGPFATLLGLALASYMVGLTMTPTRVRIGVDGVAATWMNRARFIPFTRVTEVRKFAKRTGTKTYVGIEIVLDDGSIEEIVCGQEGWLRGDIEQMLSRIQDALELNRRTGGDVAPELLARGSKSPRDWVTLLRGVGAGARADLRTPVVPLDALLRILQDAKKPPQIRVGAAVAAMAGAPDVRDRIRVAAETTASPKLRIALETVAEHPEDEEAIAEAIEALEGNAPTATR